MSQSKTINMSFFFVFLKGGTAAANVGVKSHKTHCIQLETGSLTFYNLSTPARSNHNKTKEQPNPLAVRFRESFFDSQKGSPSAA